MSEQNKTNNAKKKMAGKVDLKYHSYKIINPWSISINTNQTHKQIN